MEIIREFKRHQKDKATTLLKRKETDLFEEKRGVVSLLIGTGVANTGGAESNTSSEDWRRGLEWSAKKYIIDGNQEEQTKIELLRKVLVEGALCIRSGERSLNLFSEHLGLSWSESLELFEQAIGIAESAYRKNLDEDFNNTIERLKLIETA